MAPPDVIDLWGRLSSLPFPKRPMMAGWKACPTRKDPCFKDRMPMQKVFFSLTCPDVHIHWVKLQVVAKPQRTDKGTALSVGAVREPPEIRALLEAPLPCHMSIWRFCNHL